MMTNENEKYFMAFDFFCVLSKNQYFCRSNKYQMKMFCGVDNFFQKYMAENLAMSVFILNTQSGVTRAQNRKVFRNLYTPQHCFFAVRRFFDALHAIVQICAQPSADIQFFNFLHTITNSRRSSPVAKQATIVRWTSSLLIIDQRCAKSHRRCRTFGCVCPNH